MSMNEQDRSVFISLLHKEVVPALGCTEPIAVALCAARAAEELGTTPERMDVAVSANLLHIEKISESGMIIGAWTVDNIHLLDKLYEKGVFEITTNMIYPS